MQRLSIDYELVRASGSATQTDWLEEYADGRALAWIDETFDEKCYEWARNRREPTLLIDTESGGDLLDVHVDALVGWARSLRKEGVSR